MIKGGNDNSAVAVSQAGACVFGIYCPASSTAACLKDEDEEAQRSTGWPVPPGAQDRGLMPLVLPVVPHVLPPAPRTLVSVAGGE